MNRLTGLTTPFRCAIPNPWPVSQTVVPADLRARLETARLELPALFGALDHMDLTPAEIPQRLIRQLLELDADDAEALWALDQPPGTLDMNLMLRDMLASLEHLPGRSTRFRSNLPSRVHPTLAQMENTVRQHLLLAEAYNMGPGRDPQNA